MSDVPIRVGAIPIGLAAARATGTGEITATDALGTSAAAVAYPSLVEWSGAPLEISKSVLRIACATGGIVILALAGLAIWKGLIVSAISLPILAVAIIWVSRSYLRIPKD